MKKRERRSHFFGSKAETGVWQSLVCRSFVLYRISECYLLTYYDYYYVVLKCVNAAAESSLICLILKGEEDLVCVCERRRRKFSSAAVVSNLFCVKKFYTANRMYRMRKNKFGLAKAS